MESDDATLLSVLAQYRAGEAGALDRLVPLVYEDLRRIARRQARAGGGLSLDTTALVHEAYLKMVEQSRLQANDRGHLLAICARAMRQYVIGQARQRLADKRGGGARPVTLDSAPIAVQDQADQLVLIEQALQHLDQLDERLVRVFECRYFAGLSEPETAEALGVPLRTVQRDWMRARAWLRDWIETRA